MNNKIIKRIIKKSGCSDLLQILTEKISLPDLQSLLLEVYRKITKHKTPKDLMEQYENNRFVKPATAHPVNMLEFDRIAFKILPAEFEILELSPVCPLGSNSIIAPVDQNNTVTTIRNTEVCSDSTNVMVLECASRRKKNKTNKIPAEIKLCSSHRLLRTQLFDEPAAFAHFRILSLCTAGRDTGSFEFETNNLTEHVEYNIRLLNELNKSDYSFDSIKIVIFVSNENLHNILKQKTISNLSSKYASIKFKIETNFNNNYYSNLRYQIYVKDLKGQDFFIVDGGDTNWTKQLLSNEKERFFITGFGSERFIACFST